MPTPAKLVCAVLFAALAWWTGHLIVQIALPEGAVPGRFREWMALGGLIIGWRFVGRRASGPTNQGGSISVSVTAGIGGAVILTVLGLFLTSFVTMITASLGSVYTEIGAAVTAWMDFLMQDLRAVAHPTIIGTLYGGAAAVGLIGGIVGRTLR
jgi:hypothetical protein